MNRAPISSRLEVTNRSGVSDGMPQTRIRGDLLESRPAPGVEAGACLRQKDQDTALRWQTSIRRFLEHKALFPVFQFQPHGRGSRTHPQRPLAKARQKLRPEM